MKKVSIITKIPLRMDCQDLFYMFCVCDKFKYLSFLDSSLVPNIYSNFSYIAWKPDHIIKSDGSVNEIIDPHNGSVRSDLQHPLSFLKKVFNSEINKNNKKFYKSGNKIKPVSDLSLKAQKDLPDFTGGFIGYLSYDLKDFIEKLPRTVIDDQNVPAFYFVWYSQLLAFNHNTCTWYYIFNSTFSEPARGYTETASQLEDICKRLSDEVTVLNKEIRSLVGSVSEPAGKPIMDSHDTPFKDSIERTIIKKYILKKIEKINMTSNFNKQDYLDSVKKAKQYIHNGDIYQMNMTQRFKCDMDVEAYDLYYILRKINAAPFSAFLSYPELKIGSSSPERFLFMSNNVIQTRPIKGTRPRGRDLIGDEKNIMELLSSEKDRAELNMIVDLERNDLGKFCRYGTVKVSGHAVVEKYAKVFHLVSTVTGLVKQGYDIADIIKATFPGGSITGAPKIRAMEIIDELETTARGVYTGSIGYIGHDNTMDLNIVIRTFIIKDNIFYYNVGGGIVEDSVPEEEYQETLDKGLALKETLEFFLYKNLSNLLKQKKNFETS